MTTTFADLTEEQIKFRMLFAPAATERIKSIIDKKARFVHYTTAEVAASIIENRAVWMRNATTMNDFSEVEHGLRCIYYAVTKHQAGNDLKVFLESFYPGLLRELFEQFDGWQNDMRLSTYMTCLSEHLDSEDENGRLSMWRAYGGRSGVALVLNTTPFNVQTDALAAYSNPVAYEDERIFADRFGSLVAGLVANQTLVQSVGRDILKGALFNTLRFAALCTKHPGFAEELEWRIIYSPNLQRSRAITEHVHTVRGSPQIVQKIPLRNDPVNGLIGADISSLLDRVIIGPAVDRFAIAQGLQALLTAAGVVDADKKIFVSGIPLRHY